MKREGTQRYQLPNLGNRASPSGPALKGWRAPCKRRQS